MNHIITLTLHLLGNNELGNTSVRKSWNLDKSPFWTEYLEAKPSDRRVAYPVLPYPRSIFRNIYLKESIRFDFESGYFVETFVDGSEFQREIQVDALAKTVMIRRASDAYKNAQYADAKDAELFISVGWKKI